MGMKDCGFEVRTETADEAMMIAGDHAKRIHPDKMKEMMKTMTDPQLKQAMMAAVKNV